MKVAVWQYLVVGSTLMFASTAAAQVPGGFTEARPQLESPTSTPAESDEQAPTPTESSAEDSTRTESSTQPPAPVQTSAPSPTRVELEPDVEGLEDLSLVELMDVKIAGAGFFSLPAEKAPNVSYKLEAKTFSKLPVRTVAQLLDSTVPGLVVGNNRFFGPVIAQRGSIIDSNSKTVVMLDGQN